MLIMLNILNMLRIVDILIYFTLNMLTSMSVYRFVPLLHRSCQEQISSSTALVELIHVCGVPRRNCTTTSIWNDGTMPKNAQNLQVLERYRKMMEISWIDNDYNGTMMVLDRPGPSIAIISQDGIDAMAKHAETGGSNHTSFWDLLRSLKPAACAALRNPLRTVASAVLPEADARCPWSQANFCSGLQIFRLAVSMNWDSDGLGL